jgi:hypothetical protein
MLARPKGLHCPFRMEVIRQWNVNRVDIGVIEKRIIGVVCPLSAPTEPVSLGGFWSTA